MHEEYRVQFDKKWKKDIHKKKEESDCSDELDLHSDDDEGSSINTLIESFKRTQCIGWLFLNMIDEI